MKSTNHSTFYSISDLASEFDVTTRAIRFYEEKGLLSPIREGNSRIYTSADKVKLKLILRGKRLGLTLDESRDIIDMYDPDHGNVEQLKKLIAKYQEKRRQLECQHRDLEVMMQELQEAEEKCTQALALTESNNLSGDNKIDAANTSITKNQ